MRRVDSPPSLRSVDVRRAVGGNVEKPLAPGIFAEHELQLPLRIVACAKRDRLKRQWVLGPKRVASLDTQPFGKRCAEAPLASVALPSSSVFVCLTTSIVVPSTPKEQSSTGEHHGGPAEGVVQSTQSIQAAWHCSRASHLWPTQRYLSTCANFTNGSTM